MTKRIIVILISMPILGFSQLYIGPALAGRVSTVSFFEPRSKEDFDAAPGFGFDAGLAVSKRMKEKYCLNVQLLYSRKNKITKGGSGEFADPLFKNHLHNNYLELPISYTLEFKRSVGGNHAGMAKTYNWFVGAGPTVSYWMGGKGKLSSSEVQEDLVVSQVAYKVRFNMDSAQLVNARGAHIMNVSNPNRIQLALNFTGGVALEPIGFQKIILAAHLEIGQTFFAKTNDVNFLMSKNDNDPQRANFHSLRFSVSYLIDTKIENRQRGKSTIKNKSAANVRKKKR
jgi:Outer membrane protein beta-barrel domain